MKKLKGRSIISGLLGRRYVFSLVTLNAAFYLPYFYMVNSYEEN